MRSPSLISSSKTEERGGGGGGRGGGSGKKADAMPCCSKVGLKRGPWTAEEDELLADYIKKEGEGRWRTLPNKAGLLRCGKSCRLRWMNYLRPSVKRGHISPDEEDLILRLHRLLGNRWSLIAGRIPGRTDNEIKNYWNTHLSKKLINQGIDPKTHKPLLNPNIPSINKKLDHSSSKAINPKPNNIPIAFENDEDVHKRDLRSNGNISNEDIGDDMINFCIDDAFSSFLNSLINDDTMINSNYQLHHQEQDQENQQANLIEPSSNDDRLIISCEWDSSSLASVVNPNHSNQGE
ncbi:hypothetical protein BUALT_Bualt02G0014000 [Buddleja alternifolia]|uniref:Uncharacterized protein n=1 Tax=Buddleja alternifolia TaxID=168488 RepID=A0AAV6Y4K2_9LAMI|nr:hypothetical protein BUALT_Bualt02G0014000 [Buddleja alternifolia]